MKKIKVIRELVSEISFGGKTVFELIKELKEDIKELSPAEQVSARIVEEYTGWDSNPAYNIVYDTLETDAEFEKRKKAAVKARETKKRAKQKREEKERATFERLKKKFQ